MIRSTAEKILLLAFWTCYLTIAIAKVAQWTMMEYILTPLPPLILMVLYAHLKRKDQTIYFAFAFCLVGDVMILGTDINYFISGLTAYWGASILFSFSLHRELDTSMHEALKKSKMSLPFYIYGIYFFFLMYFIQPYMADVFIPTLIYALSLSFACAFSFVVYFNNKTKTSLYFCIGLFSASIAASIIGVNRFYFTLVPLRFFETFFYAPSLYFIFLYFKTKKTSDY